MDATYCSLKFVVRKMNVGSNISSTSKEINYLQLTDTVVLYVHKNMTSF
jgi:hypothetical protein